MLRHLVLLLEKKKSVELVDVEHVGLEHVDVDVVVLVAIAVRHRIKIRVSDTDLDSEA